MRKVICVVGPTGSGKSDLAQELACALDGEIVSADSMQIYAGMDIGTGKVMPHERRVPHFGLDLVDPGQPYSASLFQEYARSCFKDISVRGKQPILCGGTGFYVRAAIDDYDFPNGEQVDNPVRDFYNAMALKQGGQAVWDALHEKDPESADAIHPNNVKRVIRALELNSEGVRYVDQLASLGSIEQKVPAVFVGLSHPRELLYERINARVDGMVEAGLVAEVRRLLDEGFRDGVTAQQAIGYKEIVEAFEGGCTMEEAIESIKQSTRRYAKRQISWFGKDKRVTWLEAQGKTACQLAEEALSGCLAEFTL